jgi:hypothetical protein
MKLSAVMSVISVLVFAAACDPGATDPPDVARRKVECKRLEEHIFRITPESRSRLDGLPEAEQQKLIEQLVAHVPVEDLEQCAAAKPEAITCMQKAPDTAALRACIPAPKKG